MSLEEAMKKFAEKMEERKKKDRERYHADLGKNREKARKYARERYQRIKSNPLEYALFIEKQMFRNYAKKVLGKQLLEKFNNKCSVCGTAEKLEFHHNKYTNNIEDIIVVCRKCHKNHFHHA